MKKLFTLSLALASVLSLAQTQPKILLVHGAFADGSSWSKVVSLLQRDGYVVEALQNDMHTLSGDIEHTKARIEAMGGPVVVVGHSYGGAVISGAASGESSVKALVFVAAFAPDKGDSLNSLSSGGGPKPPIVDYIRPTASGDLYIDPVGFVKYFANHVPAGLAKAMAASQRPIAAAAFGEPLSVEPAWKTIPSYYAVSKDDQVIPTGAEEFFAKRVNAKTTIRVNAGHASMVSNPLEIAALIVKAAIEAGK